MTDPAYPWLSEWVTGAVPGNIWADLLADQGGGAGGLLAAMEAIIARLEATAPLRLPRKRRDFRRGADNRNQLNLRLELLIAYKLAEASIAFEFGRDAQPDIGITAAPCPIWLEVTAKDRDDILALHEEMEAALAGSLVLVQLRIPQRRLKIHVADRHSMCERVRLTATTMTGPHQIVALAEVDGSASITAGGGFDVSRVVLDNINSELTDHYSNVERELFNALDIKTDQARKGDFHPNTLLVVDASRLGLSWLRPETVWGSNLAGARIDWANLPFLGLLVCFTSLNTLHVGGALVFRHEITQAQISAVDPIAKALGFTQTTWSSEPASGTADGPRA